MPTNVGANSDNLEPDWSTLLRVRAFVAISGNSALTWCWLQVELKTLMGQALRRRVPARILSGKHLRRSRPEARKCNSVLAGDLPTHTSAREHSGRLQSSPPRWAHEVDRGGSIGSGPKSGWRAVQVSLRTGRSGLEFHGAARDPEPGRRTIFPPNPGHGRPRRSEFPNDPWSWLRDVPRRPINPPREGPAVEPAPTSFPSLQCSGRRAGSSRGSSKIALSREPPLDESSIDTSLGDPGRRRRKSMTTRHLAPGEPQRPPNLDSPYLLGGSPRCHSSLRLRRSVGGSARGGADTSSWGTARRVVARGPLWGWSRFSATGGVVETAVGRRFPGASRC